MEIYCSRRDILEVEYELIIFWQQALPENRGACVTAGFWHSLIRLLQVLAAAALSLVFGCGFNYWIQMTLAAGNLYEEASNEEMFNMRKSPYGLAECSMDRSECTFWIVLQPNFGRQ